MPPQWNLDGIPDATGSSTATAKKYSPQEVQNLIRTQAGKLGVPADLALAIAENESSFDPDAVGKVIAAGPAKGQQARGVFQLVPGTAQKYGVQDPHDLNQNVTGGLTYIKDLLGRHGTDVDSAIREYGGVVNDTKYLPKIRAARQRYAAAGTGGTGTSTSSFNLDGIPDAKPDAAPPPAARSATMLWFGFDPVQQFGSAIKSLGKAAIVDPIMGMANLAGTAVTEGPLAAAKQIGHGIVDPVIKHGSKATAARHAHDPLTWAKEIAQAIPVVGPILGEVGAQAATGDIGGAVGTAAGNLLLMKGLTRSTPAGARAAVAESVQASAARSMGKMLQAVTDGSPEAIKMVDKVIPLALDRAILRSTKNRMVQALGAAKSAVGKDVGAELQQVGHEIVPVQPVVDALNQLEQTVTNYVPINQTGNPIGAGALGATGRRGVAFNARLVQQIDKLRTIIQSHGPTVRLRQLVDLRRDWDEFVFKGKSFLNRDKMKVQYESRAKAAATNAIRDIIDQDPRLIKLSDLDQAYHLHTQLYNMIADETFGKGHAIPYYPGFGMKSALLRRMFTHAVQMPVWKLMNVQAKTRLAKAMAANNQGAIRAILRPILAGSVSEIGRKPASADQKLNLDDLSSAVADQDLINKAAASATSAAVAP